TVPDSLGQDIIGDHILGSGFPPQVDVHNSNCKLEKQVMIAAIDRGDRDNDESDRNANLPQEVMGLIESSGKLKRHNGGRGQRVQG
ncbi:hypothetical protein Ancab_039127, partial [Ancistrocladus abbreviatus]